MTKIITKGQEVAADVTALLRARTPLLWVVTKEEGRVEQYLIKAAGKAGYVTRTWDVADGIRQITGAPVDSSNLRTDPGEALTYIKQCANEKKDRCVWIMRDLHEWVNGPVGPITRRQLRNLAKELPGIETSGSQAVIVLAPSSEIPAELAGHATLIDWPLPDRIEIGTLLDSAITALPETDKEGTPVREPATPKNGAREAAIDAAIGLTGEEAQSCFAKSLVSHRKIDPVAIAQEKKRIIARERVMEWYDPLPGGLDAVGGLDVLKSWLMARKSAYSAKARAYGLPAPKGSFLVGVPGCGKSLLAKATATAWGVPLLKLDLGALKSKFVGESEGNLRKAFKVIEAIGRCVVWIDEIEKSLQGATSGASDGGVSSDALGALLNWMQERSGQAFVIATANAVDQLPPELLRAGRFDVVWWVDLPTEGERTSILKTALRSNGRDKLDVDINTIAKACKNFTGSEIASIVPDALFVGFEDGGREITTEDLLNSAKKVVPLAKTAKERIEKLRQWADGRARSATSKIEDQEQQPTHAGRHLEF